MTAARMALLPDRGVVRVAGEDAEKLLQGIITNSTELLAKQSAIHTALLTPQGKILFEFFIAKGGGGFLLETARDQATNLVKRLTMYKLRAKVDIVDASAGHRVLALWGASPQRASESAGSVSFTDPRLPGLGLRIVADAKLAPDAGARAAPEEFQAHRIALGVPEGGKDYAFGDVFPHEANLDALRSISFDKGCFVGQEVVSRMQHRGSARKRIVIVEADKPLHTGSEVMADQATIGTIGSVAGNRALALVRVDRAEEAKSKGQPLTAGGTTISVRLPGYLKSATVGTA